MNGNCHFLFGAAVSTAVTINLAAVSSYLPNITNTSETVVLFVLGGLLGGIFPDIDSPTSYVGKLTSPVSKIIGEIGKAAGKTGKNHRGIFHDPIVYIAGLILSYIYFTPLVGFFVGCLSHIFLDMFNPAGIPFLFNISWVRLGKIPSGSKASVVFTWLCAGTVIFFGVALKTGLLLEI